LLLVIVIVEIIKNLFGWPPRNGSFKSQFPPQYPERKVNRPHPITQTINEYDEKSADTYQMEYFVMLIKNEKAADKAGQSTPPAQIIYNVLIISTVWARK